MTSAWKIRSYAEQTLTGNIYVDNCTMEGLCSAGNIQSCPADALIAIFHLKSFGPVLKWVDDLYPLA